MSEKLLVWTPNGEIQICQDGVLDRKKIIDAYAEDGRSAAFFDLPSYDFGDRFIHRGRLAERPRLRLRVDRNRVRANGEDQVNVLGVPVGLEISVFDGVKEDVIVSPGTTVPLAFLMPGRYTITARGFPYVEQQLQVEAV